MRDKISACVITFNEEEHIGRCLDSLAWCDEIVVVDSFSTDRTVEICRRHTDRVYQHEWLGYIGQRNLIQKMAAHPWILLIDADEEVSPTLRDEVLALFEAGTNRCAGYEFPRLVHYLGRWIRHGSWYPDIKLRLFRADRGRSGGIEPHDQVLVDGPVGRLRHPIWHYTYRDITDHLNTVNRFSSISARSLYERGRRASLADFLLRPAWRFVKGYVVRRGFLDGRRGLVIAALNALGVAAKYAKLWELEWNGQPRPGNRP